MTLGGGGSRHAKGHEEDERCRQIGQGKLEREVGSAAKGRRDPATTAMARAGTPHRRSGVRAIANRLARASSYRHVPTYDHRPRGDFCRAPTRAFERGCLGGCAPRNRCLHERRSRRGPGRELRSGPRPPVVRVGAFGRWGLGISGGVTDRALRHRRPGAQSHRNPDGSGRAQSSTALPRASFTHLTLRVRARRLCARGPG